MSSPDLDFDYLRQLHESVNDRLHSPNTKLEIINHGHQKWAHQVSESALKMADSCSAAKDLLLLAKDHIQSLQSAFRRIPTTDDHEVGNNFAPYRLPRKQLKKAILKRLDSLKGTKTSGPSVPAGPTAEELEEDQSLVVVVNNMLKEVRAATLSIVRSLSTLIAMPTPDGRKSLTNKRKDPVFRLKLTRVDSFSCWEKCTVSDVRAVMKRLEEVEVVVDEMEDELERMFRRLITTRASLLNILTT